MMTVATAEGTRRKVLSNLTMGDMDMSSGISPANFRDIQMFGDSGLTPNEIRARMEKLKSIGVLKNAAQPQQPQQEEPMSFVYFGTPPNMPPFVTSVDYVEKPGEGILLMDDANPKGDGIDRISDIVKATCFYMITKALPTPAPGNILSPLKKTIDVFAEQNFFARAKSDFPTLSKYYAFTQGLTTVKNYYTVEYVQGGVRKETAVYIDNPKVTHGMSPPESEIVKLAAECVKKPETADANNKRILNGSFNEIIGQTGADKKILNGDLKNVKDPTKFRQMLNYVDLYLIQQSGPRSVIGAINPAELPADVSEAKVIKYGRPGRLQEFAYTLLFDKAYDMIDNAVFNPLGPYIGSDPETMQTYIAEELAAVEKLVRHLWNKRPDCEHYT